MEKITTMLWFDGQAEEAAKFYVSVFKNSKMGKVARYGDAGPGPKGAVMVASFDGDSVSRVSTCAGFTGMQATGHTCTHCGSSKWPTHSVHLRGSMT